MLKRLIIWCLLFLSFGLTAADAELALIKVALPGGPQAKYVGFYFALQAGFYREVGLNVELIYGRDSKPALDYLKNGEAQFAVSSLAPAIRFSASGWEVVNICQLMQRSGMIVVAYRNQGIHALRDLDGRKIAVAPWDDRETLLKLLSMRGVRVELLPDTEAKIELFLNHAVDGMAGMYYDDYKMLLDSGLNQDELMLFRLSEARPYIPEDGIYVLDSVLKIDPLLCRRFAEATVRGYTAAFARRADDALLDALLKSHIGSGSAAYCRDHQKWMFEAVKKMMMPDAENISGELGEREYENIGEILSQGRQKPYREFFRYYRTLKEVANEP